MEINISIILSVLTALCAIIWFSVKKWIGNISKEIEDLKEKFDKLQVDIIKNYLTKEEYKYNEKSHKELWTEVNIIRERISKIEK